MQPARSGHPAIPRRRARCRRPSNACARTICSPSVFPDQVACAENLTGPIRIPDHPLVNETIDNCLHEAMDLDGLEQSPRGIEAGAIRTVAIDTPEPSLFSHEILNANPYAYPRRRSA